MTPHRHCVALCFFACAGSAQAGPLALEAAHGVERLNAGLADWRQSEFLALWRDPAGWATNGSLRRTERFGLVDRQLEAGGSIELAPQWRAEAEIALSATHRVLPASRWRGRMWRDGVAGWNLALGAGRTLYRGDGATQGSALAELQAERYVADWRFAWAGSATRLDGGGLGSAHVWRANWYLDERLALGTVLAFGREFENTPGSGVVSSSVRSAAITAQWAVAPAWSLSGAMSSHRQGDLYERNGWWLGLRVQH